MVIDLKDWELYGSRKWHKSDTGYAVNRGRVDGDKRTIRFHRLVAGTPEGLFTDHLNHDRLDNRKKNLRVCSHESNVRNRPSGEKGYCWDESKQKWMVRYRHTFYGRYATEEEAQGAVKLARSGVPYEKKRARRRRFDLPTGVFRNKSCRGYQAKAQIAGVRYYLGVFETIEEAERAYKDIIKEKRQ